MRRRRFRHTECGVVIQRFCTSADTECADRREPKMRTRPRVNAQCVIQG
jgi:hypothetical protein